MFIKILRFMDYAPRPSEANDYRQITDERNTFLGLHGSLLDFDNPIRIEARESNAIVMLKADILMVHSLFPRL